MWVGYARADANWATASLTPTRTPIPPPDVDADDGVVRILTHSLRRLRKFCWRHRRRPQRSFAFTRSESWNWNGTNVCLERALEREIIFAVSRICDISILKVILKSGHLPRYSLFAKAKRWPPKFFWHCLSQGLQYTRQIFNALFPLSDAFVNKEYFFCIACLHKQFNFDIYGRIACFISTNEILFSLF